MWISDITKHIISPVDFFFPNQDILNEGGSERFVPGVRFLLPDWLIAKTSQRSILRKSNPG